MTELTPEARADFEQLIERLAAMAICKDDKGRYYTWIPSPRNPSKVILHFWNPETDTWEDAGQARCLPSKSWGSWPE